MSGSEIAANDIYWLREAYSHAAQVSRDPSTQNGAVIVRDGVRLMWSTNNFAFGVKESAGRWQRPLKYQYVEHAERNSIYAAAMLGIRLQGSTMYCPWAACSDCARAIIQSGIVEVIGHDSPLHQSRPDWQDSILIATQMFREAGVLFRTVKCEIGQEIRFNGKIVNV